MLNGTCCSTPAYSSRFMGREKKQAEGQRRCQCVVCVLQIYENAFMHLEMKCIKRWRQWKNTNCHSAGDSGHQESSMMPAGEQGSRSLVTGSQHVAGPAGSKHLEASLWTSQQEPGTEQRAGGWGGSQGGYLAAARGQLVRELATQSHKKGCLLFFSVVFMIVHIF